MLYKPTFCCQCGNRIERINWNLWTSRRFCENCEGEFRKDEWLPTVFFVSIALLGGLVGFGSYLKTPQQPLSLTSNRINSLSTDKLPNKNGQEPVNANISKIASPVSANVNQNAAIKTISAPPNPLKASSLQNEADEPVYFCGAQTKKGTPCNRRVKGGGRCWQHTGQPSMLPKDKLLAAH